MGGRLPEAHNPGVGGCWDSCKQPGVDDVAFIAALIDELMRSEGIDPEHVCVAGFSRGAMMAYRLGCELGDRLVAIAPVAGNMADEHGSVEVGRHPARPVGLLVVHGLADRNVPIEGGPSPDYPDQVAYAPLSDVLRRWREWNGCGRAREQVALEGSVTVRRWARETGAPVELRLVDGLTATPGRARARLRLTRAPHSTPRARSPTSSPPPPADRDGAVLDAVGSGPVLDQVAERRFRCIDVMLRLYAVAAAVVRGTDEDKIYKLPDKQLVATMHEVAAWAVRAKWEAPAEFAAVLAGRRRFDAWRSELLQLRPTTRQRRR